MTSLSWGLNLNVAKSEAEMLKKAIKAAGFYYGLRKRSNNHH